MNIQLDTAHGGSVLIAILQGELDHHSADGVREAIDKELNKMPIPRLLLDLADLTFMDSSGLGVILGRYRKIQSKHGIIVIANVPAFVTRLFELSGLYKIMRFYDSREKALSSMKEVSK